MKSIIELNPESYARHFIHSEGRRWAETNCYMDVLIELIHSLGFEPVAAMAPVISIDFEVDQWTFFKFEHRDLLDLFGIEIHELNPWRCLPTHVEEQVESGRPVLVELDSFYLPDTEGSAYKTTHTKSTVAVNEISVRDAHMGYFHGQGYYHLDGDDFRSIFQLDGLVHDRMLPPYIEFGKLHKQHRDIDREYLVRQSRRSLIHQLSILPEENPFSAFRRRFQSDLEWLREEPIDMFHGYSFATLRQYGACFELAETFLQWLAKEEDVNIEEAIQCFGQISEQAKLFQFKLARSISRGKQMDIAPLEHMGEAWRRAMDTLLAEYR